MPNLEKIVGNLYSVFTTFFSMKDIEKELQGEVQVAICGNSPKTGELHEAMNSLKTEEADEKKNLPPEVLRLCQYPPDSEDMEFLKKCHVAVFVMKGDDLNIDILRELGKSLPHEEKKYLWFVDGAADEMRRDEVKDLFEEVSVEEIHWIHDEWKKLPSMVLTLVQEKGLAYAQKFSMLRDEMASRLIRNTARQNASVSFFSSLPSNIPIIGIIIGLIAVTGETLIITANQVRLCLRIAGVYGHALDFYARMAELWPVLAGGFGWRTLARTLTGFIPGGGPLLKTAISYAGTITAGETARWYYRDGKKLTREEIKALYDKEKSKILDSTNAFLHKLKDTDQENGGDSL
ncbi:MAG: hypothetical protein RDV48_13680 [Candidatus Eremiobacteraeota bacterium]|nr:hypothetical protein [Candidatus Eremiobacteraeota bacterium]